MDWRSRNRDVHTFIKRTCQALVAAICLVIASQVALGGDITTLRPRPKAAFERTGTFTIFYTTFLVRPNSPSVSTWSAIELIQRAIKPLLGDTLNIVPYSQYIGGSAVFVGERGLLTPRLAGNIPPGETEPGAQGYVIDISSSMIVLAGTDSDGTLNGATTVTQLMNEGTNLVLHCAHIWDVPDYPTRWVSAGYHVNIGSEFRGMRSLLDTMTKYKLNGIRHDDTSYSAETVSKKYRDSMALFRQLAQQAGVQIVPAGIALHSGILAADPNLVESAPVTQTYVMNADTGVEITDPRVAIKNGGFESVTNGEFTTGENGWTSITGAAALIDSTVYHSGHTSARCEMKGGNSIIFTKRISCNPNSSYFLSAWVKTDSIDSPNPPELLAQTIDSVNIPWPISSGLFHVPATSNGWIHLQMPFNTLTNSRLDLSCDLSYAFGGKIWWDDVTVIDAGLNNVVRRAGTPLHVYNQSKHAPCFEGIDFFAIVDTLMNQARGNYGLYHAPPTFQRIALGNIANGDTLVVMFYTPVIGTVHLDGSASAMFCVSEDTLYGRIAAQTKRTDSLLNPQSWMTLDPAEPPVALNRDSACLSTGLSDAGLFSNFVRRTDSIVTAAHAGATVIVPGMMFDVWHSDRSLSKSVVIENDDSGEIDYFTTYGYRQLAWIHVEKWWGGDTNGIEEWRQKLDTITTMQGGIYSTDSANYRLLSVFSDYFWSAGPYIMHAPLDSTALFPNALHFSATILADPNDSTDSIVTAAVQFLDSAGKVLNIVALNNAGANSWVTTGLPHSSHAGFRYRIIATDAEGFHRIGNTYFVGAVLPSLALAAPSLTLPVDDANCVPVAPARCTWSNIAGASTFHLEITTDSTFKTVDVDQANLSQNNAYLLFATNATKYFWRVRAETGNEYGPWSAVRHFTTVAAAPLLNVPVELAQLLDTTVKFQWQNVINAKHYAFDIDTVPDFHSAHVLIPTDSVFVILHLRRYTTYYWRVQVADANFCGPWSEVRSFVTVDSTALPTKVVLISPRGLTNVSSSTETLQYVWKRVLNTVTKYQLEITEYGDSAIVRVDSTLGDTSIIIPTPWPLTSHVFSWRARGGNNVGWGLWSDTNHFTLTTTAVGEIQEMPSALSLTASPNPFAESTTLHLALSEDANAELTVMNMLGEPVATLHRGFLERGMHEFMLNASRLPAGVYLCRLTTIHGAVQRMVVVAR